MSKVSLVLSRLIQNLASLRIRHKILIITFVSLLIFALSKGPPPGQNHFVYLADAFLHGRLGLSGSGTSLAELVNYQGNFYVVYPPMPAVLLMPFVAIFGTSFDQSLLSIILASLSVAAIWLMLKKTGTNSNKAPWLAALFGFGTCFWFIASIGSSWYIEHASAVLFLTGAIILALYKKNNFFVGLLLGCATLSRLPVVLSFPFFLLLTYEQNNAWKPRLKQAAIFFIGLAIPVGLNALYNFVRYGTLLDVGYTLIPGILLYKRHLQPQLHPTPHLRNLLPRTNSPKTTCLILSQAGWDWACSLQLPPSSTSSRDPGTNSANMPL